MYKIGELSRRTGLPVKTIRYYSDIGLLPEYNRTQGRFRLYSDADMARLRLVIALRELGLDLATIRSAVDQRLPFEQVIDLRLQAVERDVQSLEKSRAVLRALRDCGDASADTAARLHEFGQMSAADRQEFVAHFYRSAAEGSSAPPEFVAALRAASTPGPADELTAEQLSAWLELAQLLEDDEFLASLRVMGRSAWGTSPRSDYGDLRVRGDEAVARAAEAGRRQVSPSSPEAAAVLDDFLSVRAAMLGRRNDRDFRACLLHQFEVHDPRADRYWELIAIIKRWPTRDKTIGEAFRWLSAALKQRVAAEARCLDEDRDAR